MWWKGDDADGVGEANHGYEVTWCTMSMFHRVLVSVW